MTFLDIKGKFHCFYCRGYINLKCKQKSLTGFNSFCNIEDPVQRFSFFFIMFEDSFKRVVIAHSALSTMKLYATLGFVSVGYLTPGCPWSFFSRWVYLFCWLKEATKKEAINHCLYYLTHYQWSYTYTHLFKFKSLCKLHTKSCKETFSREKFQT